MAVIRGWSGTKFGENVGPGGVAWAFWGDGRFSAAGDEAAFTAFGVFLPVGKTMVPFCYGVAGAGFCPARAFRMGRNSSLDFTQNLEKT